MNQPYRAITWNPSNFGSACIREILRLPDFELSGARGRSERKNYPDLMGKVLGALSTQLAKTAGFS